MFKTRRHYAVPLPDGRTLKLGERTLVMGVINVTPDSFADGGIRLDPQRAIEDGLRMIEEGADILDVGGESTRPGAEALSADEELRRVLPVIDGLTAGATAPISIDTYKGSVAREAIARGASIVNDVSMLQYDADLVRAAVDTGAALVLMHNRGRSRAMYDRAEYDDVARDVVNELRTAIEQAATAGVRRDRIIVDPGIGFAKRAEQSFAVLARLDTLAQLDRPILSGPSRKSFLREALGDRPPSEREWGTAAAVVASVLSGAHIVRVHGVREMVDAVRVADRLRAAAGY